MARFFAIAALALAPAAWSGSTDQFVSTAAAAPWAVLVSATPLLLPGTVDSNSPLVWDLEDGQHKLFAMTSHSGRPSIAIGSAIDRFGANADVSLLPHPGHSLW